MPVQWNGADPRAVILPATSAITACEVLSATPHLVLASPGAYCVGLYAHDSAIPLRYVPARSAVGANIPSGWYAPLLSVDTQFAIAVTPTLCAKRAAAKRGADALAIYVDVCGTSAHEHGRELDLGLPHEYVVRGFTLRAKATGVDVERTYQQFTFPTRAFDVVVSCRGAQRGSKRPSSASASVRPTRSSRVTRAAGGVRRVHRVVRTKQYNLLGLWPIAQFSIVVHVRPYKWLVEHGVFEKSDLQPPHWIDRRGSAYFSGGVPLPLKEARQFDNFRVGTRPVVSGMEGKR